MVSQWLAARDLGLLATALHWALRSPQPGMAAAILEGIRGRPTVQPGMSLRAHGATIHGSMAMSEPELLLLGLLTQLENTAVQRLQGLTDNDATADIKVGTVDALCNHQSRGFEGHS